MDRLTRELSILTAVSALSCGMVAGAVFAALFCTNAAITLSLMLRS
jgi:hypothetical protein